MTDTILVCSKCGKTEEFYSAIKAGWLHAQRKNAPPGHLVIRCPDHVTGHALLLAGLPQQTTSKRIEDNIERGLWIEYGDGDYLASVYEIENDLPYVLSYHRGEMPAFKVETFRTAEALILAMRQVEPKISRWKLCEVDS